ncbi:hypothetical protein ACVMFB_008867 [Bradyrhizobium sp. USDA 4522]
MVELVAAPVSACAVTESAFRAALLGRQQRDLQLRGRPITGDREFFLAIIGDPHRRFRRAGQLDRGDRLGAEARFRAEAAADVLRDHADLVVIELVAFCDLLLQVKHLLGRGVQGQPVAVEARHRGVGLETSMLLRGGAEGGFDE